MFCGFYQPKALSVDVLFAVKTGQEKIRTALAGLDAQFTADGCAEAISEVLSSVEAVLAVESDYLLPELEAAGVDSEELESAHEGWVDRIECYRAELFIGDKPAHYDLLKASLPSLRTCASAYADYMLDFLMPLIRRHVSTSDREELGKQLVQSGSVSLGDRAHLAPGGFSAFGQHERVI